jgi:hypothetical protein
MVKPEPVEEAPEQTDSLEMPSSAETPPEPGKVSWPDIEAPAPTKTPHKPWWQRFSGRFNTYTLLFSVVLLIGLIIVAATYISSRHGSAPTDISSQTLSQKTFEQLAATDATVGSSSQVLSVQSNAVFAGKVLVRQGFEVAGNLQVGGTLGINSLAVAGTAQFGQAQVNKDLSVAGNTGLQGSLTVGKSLQVSGNGSFGGSLTAAQVTASSLQLNGDFVLTHHISIGGATPGRSNGSALGSGGTASVSGGDSGGSITINTGSGPAAGCFITVNFSARYGSTPRVILTPVGSAAGGLGYYVNRTPTSFSVCDASTPPANSSFGFDYFVFS